MCAAEAPPTMPVMAQLENAAEHGWLNKNVLETRLLDDMTELGSWSFRGQGTTAFPEPGQMRHVRVEVNIKGQQPATGRNSGLPAVTLKRAFAGEDWTSYNRLSFWVRPGHAVEMCVIGEANSHGEVTIRLTVTGSGKHTFALRTSNLAVDQPEKELTLGPGAAVAAWKGRIIEPDAPWVGVVVPDGDLGRLKEVIGFGARVPRSQAAQ